MKKIMYVLLAGMILIPGLLADDGEYKGLCKKCIEVVEKLDINH